MPKTITTTNLEAFKNRHKFSYTDLSEIAVDAGFDASRSTVQRLCKGELAEDYAHDLRITLAHALPHVLFERGLSTAEIDFELTQIFTPEEYQPMIQPRVELTREALHFFKLKQDPFTAPPRSESDVFTSERLDAIFEQIVDAIENQKFVAVVGDIGAGKTVLRARVEDYVAKQDGKSFLIFPETFDMSRVTPGSISRAILEEFDAPKVPVDSVSRAKVVKRLLAKMHSRDVNVALGFDECHHLARTTLSSLKNFLEMSSGGFTRYLSVILFGQPSFQGVLNDPQFREISERITIIQMPAITESAAAYLKHRLRVANGDSAELFNDDATAIIARAAKTPLQLGNIANAALNEAAKMRVPQVQSDFKLLKNLAAQQSYEAVQPSFKQIKPNNLRKVK